MSKNRLSQLQQRTADNSMMVFTGNANPQLSSDVARFLNVPLGKASVESFSDGEVMVEILDNKSKVWISLKDYSQEVI